MNELGRSSIFCSRAMNTALIALFYFFIPTASIAFERTLGCDFTRDSLSNGQYNTLINTYLIQKLESDTLTESLQFNDSNNNKDTTLAFGLNHDFSKSLYLYAGGSFSPGPIIMPDNTIEIESGYNLAKPLVGIINYRRRNYSSTYVELYSAGFDYYFSFPGWLTGRSYISRTADAVFSYSSLIKLYYEPNDFFRYYIGYSSGSEAYRDSAISTYSFNASTPMAGLQYKLTGSLGIKADLSIENRDNGVTNQIFNLGIFSLW